MKKIVLVIIMLILLITACTNNNGNKKNINTDSEIINIIKDSEALEEPSVGNDIDRTEYLTGEIITDGNYSYPSNYKGIMYFVPDEESNIIIKEKYNYSAESYLLFYENMSMIENLPKELGIYKVKVKIDWNESGKSFILNNIELTDKIGTILYEGKSYETNELDENVKVKDMVCGLIVKWIDRFDGGIQIRFAGEIESEGYYSINYDLMYDENMGRIYFDEEYFNNIPFYGERGFNNFSFFKTNELFDEIQNFSAFGKGKFKTSNYLLIYNIGMGRPVSDYLTEIISLDEDYKDMFIFDKNKYVGTADQAKDFIIVSSANYEDNDIHLSTDYYYISKKNPKKLFLFSSGSYNYDLKVVANENEFILSTSGYNYITGEQDKKHIIVCKIDENGVVTERIDDLGLESFQMDNDESSFNMQGYITDIKISDNNVIITLKDIKMKKEDELAFGKALSENDSLDILSIDKNINGPLISVGDKVMISCRYTKDKEFLYLLGDDISIRN